LEAWERWPLPTSITSSGWKVPWLTFMMLDRALVVQNLCWRLCATD
jgi:hypothetical protein